jgi:hypothetical protein
MDVVKCTRIYRFGTSICVGAIIFQPECNTNGCHVVVTVETPVTYNILMFIQNIVAFAIIFYAFEERIMLRHTFNFLHLVSHLYK